MSQTPFRRDALDTMVSTEELDQASRTIQFQGRFLLTLVAVLLSIALTVSWLVTVPVKVTGPAVIWSPAGVRQISATSDGRLLEITVAPGSSVEAGEIIARLDQRPLQEQLESSQARLAALTAHIARKETLQASDEAARAEFNQKTDELIEASRRLADLKTVRLQDRRVELESLRAQGMLETETYNQLIAQIEEGEERVVALQRDTIAQLRQEHQAAFQQETELLSLRLEAEQLRTEVDLLQTQLASNGVLRSPVTGQVVEVLTAVGDYLNPGTAVAVVQPAGDDANLEAVVFVPTQAAKPIQAGMAVELELPAFTKSLYGKLLGEVAEVSPLPVSTSGLMRELRNDRLVQSITEQGSPLMVRVRLKRDPTTGDYAWSSRSAVTRRLERGQAATGGVITRQERILDLLLPDTW